MAVGASVTSPEGSRKLTGGEARHEINHRILVKKGTRPGRGEISNTDAGVHSF